MANILITEFMENEQIDIMSSKHNVSYEPEIYANSVCEKIGREDLIDELHK